MINFLHKIVVPTFSKKDCVVSNFLVNYFKKTVNIDPGFCTMDILQRAYLPI
jgi:hypothetical protein